MDRKAAAKAIDKQNLQKLDQALGEDPTSEDAEEVVRLILRSSPIIVRKSDPSLEKRRDAFLSGLTDIFKRHYGQDPHALLGPLVSVVREIEGGYRDVQSGVPMSAIASLPTNRQVSAAIKRAIIEGEVIERQAQEAINAGGWQPGLPIIAQSDDGTTYDADGARTALVRHFGATLKYLMGRFGRTKSANPLILPAAEPVTDDDVHKAGTALLASAALRRWRRIDERVRFWGGSVSSREYDKSPEGTQLEIVRAYKPESSFLYFDQIANRRLTDIFIKTFNESMQSDPADVDVEAKELAPSAYLSLDEHAAYAALKGILGLNEDSSPVEFQGLKISEWVRGYSVLRNAAQDIGQGSLTFKPQELRGMLQSSGIRPEAADIFIKYATFGDHSDDLFDCPILEFSDGAQALFRPAAVHAVIAQLVLSNLGNLGETFSGKGPAFERKVLTSFEKAGLSPKHIHAFRDGEEYEVDVVLPWGDKLFLFECKTDGLSDNDPVAAYNFEKARDRHITQILRQVAGLRKHPSLLEDVGIRDAKNLEWVPVLLYLFPYSMPIDDRGVCVADWTGLGRFLGPSRVHLPPVLINEKYHHVSAALRATEHPTPEDLKSYLQGPFQMGMKLASLEPREEMIWLKDRRLAVGVELDFGPLRLEAIQELFKELDVHGEIQKVLTS